MEVWGDYDTVVECMPTIGLRLGAILKWTTFIVNRDKVWRKIFISSLQCFNSFTSYCRLNDYHRKCKPTGSLVPTAMVMKYSRNTPNVVDSSVSFTLVRELYHD